MDRFRASGDRVFCELPVVKLAKKVVRWRELEFAGPARPGQPESEVKWTRKVVFFGFFRDPGPRKKMRETHKN